MNNKTNIFLLIHLIVIFFCMSYPIYGMEQKELMVAVVCNPKNLELKHKKLFKTTQRDKFLDSKDNIIDFTCYINEKTKTSMSTTNSWADKKTIAITITKKDEEKRILCERIDYMSYFMEAVNIITNTDESLFICQNTERAYLIDYCRKEILIDSPIYCFTDRNPKSSCHTIYFLNPYDKAIGILNFINGKLITFKDWNNYIKQQHNDEAITQICTNQDGNIIAIMTSSNKVFLGKRTDCTERFEFSLLDDLPINVKRLITLNNTGDTLFITNFNCPPNDSDKIIINTINTQNQMPLLNISLDLKKGICLNIYHAILIENEKTLKINIGSASILLINTQHPFT